MKKIIQIVSFLTLAFVFGGVDANAQNATKIEANVPFDFIIADKVLPAGEYVIRVTASAAGVKQIDIRNKSGEVAQIALVTQNGDTANGRSELVFDRTSGQAVLTKILTEDSGYSVPTADLARLTASLR